MFADIAGVILAGGKSKRMGENKALLKLGGIPIIERTATLLRKLFPEVIIITNTPDDYAFLGLKTYPDIYQNRGPLAGIHSALYHSLTEKNFIISCDIPFMTADVIKEIIEYKTEQPVTVVYADSYIQQLAGLYHRRILKQAEEILNSHENLKRCGVLTLLSLTGAEIIESANIPYCSSSTFVNINNPDEYKKATESFLLK